MLACGGSVWAVVSALAHVKSAGKKRGVKMVVKTAGMVVGAAFLNTNGSFKRGVRLPPCVWIIPRSATFDRIVDMCFFGLRLSFGDVLVRPMKPTLATSRSAVRCLRS